MDELMGESNEGEQFVIPEIRLVGEYRQEIPYKLSLKTLTDDFSRNPANYSAILEENPSFLPLVTGKTYLFRPLINDGTFHTNEPQNRAPKRFMVEPEQWGVLLYGIDEEGETISTVSIIDPDAIDLEDDFPDPAKYVDSKRRAQMAKIRTNLDQFKELAGDGISAAIIGSSASDVQQNAELFMVAKGLVAEITDKPPLVVNPESARWVDGKWKHTDVYTEVWFGNGTGKLIVIRDVKDDDKKIQEKRAFNAKWAKEHGITKHGDVEPLLESELVPEKSLKVHLMAGETEARQALAEGYLLPVDSSAILNIDQKVELEEGLGELDDSDNGALEYFNFESRKSTMSKEMSLRPDQAIFIISGIYHADTPNNWVFKLDGKMFASDIQNRREPAFGIFSPPDIIENRIIKKDETDLRPACVFGTNLNVMEQEALTEYFSKLAEASGMSRPVFIKPRHGDKALPDGSAESRSGVKVFFNNDQRELVVTDPTSQLEIRD